MILMAGGVQVETKGTEIPTPDAEQGSLFSEFYLTGVKSIWVTVSLRSRRMRQRISLVAPPESKSHWSPFTVLAETRCFCSSSFTSNIHAWETGEPAVLGDSSLSFLGSAVRLTQHAKYEKRPSQA
jgi:hypothetical protein